MALLSGAQRVAELRALGYLGGESLMVGNFQRGWNLGPWLAIDGLYGPATDAALRRSQSNRKAGRGTLSAHFSASEFHCRCNGRRSGCQGCWVSRAHLKRLESLRSATGVLAIVSGCRCPGHNKAVGGASSSQHMFGVACDVPGSLTLARVKGLKLFAGIGYQGSTGKVLHVDSRDLGGHNSTGGKPGAPTVWVYR